MQSREHSPPTTLERDQVSSEHLRRTLGRVYAILLDLATNETADPGDTATNQAPKSAVTDIALQEGDGWENHHADSTP
jgi:hypothetical protein